MTTQTSTSLASHSRAGGSTAEASVTSRDGTSIGYRQVGHGPGLVVVHGMMESGQSHLELAQALADTYTVFLPDRRGRGRSGPRGGSYGLQREVEDLDALLTKSSAEFVFGVSAGGLIALEAARTMPAIRKAAIFDPALIIDGSISAAFLGRFDHELAQGDVAAALVTAMLGSQMGPPVFNRIPRPLLKALTSVAMGTEDLRAKPDDVTMRMLASTLRADFGLSVEADGALDSFRSIPGQLLLLGASHSPAYFKTALAALEAIRPDARRVEFAALNHGASGNRNRGGDPGTVAQELRRFFA
jgi:pimeloyl-ACP methyl ester carboxylesterase